MKAHDEDQPIGVFDSGVGGLSVLHAIHRELPDENLLYAADSGNAPYGDRDLDFIKSRALLMTRFLLAQGAKTIVVACNTATVVAVSELRSWCPVPVVAMEPAIKPASQMTKSGIVGVLATRQTLASASVARLCEAHGDSAKFLLQACPGLVEKVERAELTSEATRALLDSYLSPLLAAGADTLVLGCTHYPFLIPLIQEIAGPEVLIIDPAVAVAKEVARRLVPNRNSMSRIRPVTTRFFSSSPLDEAQAAMSALWGEQVTVHAIG
ncbi:MAG: glutamate racemase [Comamonadaceae bacterium]